MVSLTWNLNAAREVAEVLSGISLWMSEIRMCEHAAREVAEVRYG
jgi:hypothetical protein